MADEKGIGFRITTQPHADGKITQEMKDYCGDFTRTLITWVTDTRNAGVREALIRPGWTPPKHEAPQERKE